MTRLMKFERSLYRVIDANANRAREGLRVVEEISRLILDNSQLTSEWKKARHRISTLLGKLPVNSNILMKERESDTDVGKDTYVEEENKRGNYNEIAVINARRAEEGIRVLEEFSKLIAPEIGRQFKKLRFKVYTLEKKTLAQLTKH